MSQEKRVRQAMIRRLIEDHVVSTQEELSALLASRDLATTQATISRDIKDLGLIKVPSEEGHRYALPPDTSGLVGSRDRLLRLLREVVVSFTVSENLIVVKTLPAGANVASEVIDGMGWPELAGTLAGENTVLVVAKSAKDAPILAERLEALR